MRNVIFYLATVLIWGSTWIGIKMQLGVVDPVVSVAYRFSLAALILLVWCSFRGLRMRFSLNDHLFMMLQGALLFGFNYLLFYVAELHIASGLAAVIFSTILLMNMINGAILLRTSIDLRVIVGGFFGLVGIYMVFRPEISSYSLANDGVSGVLYCLLATLLASLGNITSARNQKHGLPIVQTNAYGMAYGAFAMYLTIMTRGIPFGIDMSPMYIGSLFYLALFGSVVAFGCYLSLVGNIGADRAAYATLLFPIVALLISTIWEDYHWTFSSAVGVALILVGNLCMLNKKGGESRKHVFFRLKSRGSRSAC